MLNSQSIHSDVQIMKMSMISMEDKEIDLRDVFSSINIFEDVFSPFLTGKLCITDTGDLIKNFPIAGGEKISLVFKSTDITEYCYVDFVVYKVDKDPKVYNDNKKTRHYILYLISEEAITNNLSSVSRKFSDYGHTIIQSILYDYLETVKEIDYEECANSVEVFANFWNPVKIINFIASQSQSDYNLDYVFYENIDGFHFKSLSSLMNKKSDDHIELYYDQSSLEDFVNTNNIKSHIMISYFDLIKGANRGIFGNTFYKLDDLNYGFTKVARNAHDATEYNVSLGNHIQFQDKFYTENNQVAEKFYDIDLCSARTLIFNSLSNYNWTVKLSGLSTRRAGDLFRVRFPNIDLETYNNRMLDGKWFASRINHEILNNYKYIQKVNLIKNAFNTEDLFTEVNGRSNIK